MFRHTFKLQVNKKILFYCCNNDDDSVFCFFKLFIVRVQFFFFLQGSGVNVFTSLPCMICYVQEWQHNRICGSLKACEPVSYKMAIGQAC